MTAWDVTGRRVMKSKITTSSSQVTSSGRSKCDRGLQGRGHIELELTRKNSQKVNMWVDRRKTGIKLSIHWVGEKHLTFTYKTFQEQDYPVNKSSHKLRDSGFSTVPGEEGETDLGWKEWIVWCPFTVKIPPQTPDCLSCSASKLQALYKPAFHTLYPALPLPCPFRKGIGKFF